MGTIKLENKNKNYKITRIFKLGEELHLHKSCVTGETSGPNEVYEKIMTVISIVIVIVINIVRS